MTAAALVALLLPLFPAHPSETTNSYFNYNDMDAMILQSMNEEQCKEACLRNCSCKAALFKFARDNQNGSCYLPSQLYSLMNSNPKVNGYNSVAHIKMQIDRKEEPATVTTTKTQKEKATTATATNIATALATALATTNITVIANATTTAPTATTTTNATTTATVTTATTKTIVVIVVVILGVVFFASLAIGFIILRRRRKNALRMEKEDNFELIVGLPKRYSFEELKIATENFCQKLGQGGFGSVFEGTLNGERVAVKLLDGVGQGMKEFLAEIKTIGNIHYINLVRLVGFCWEKSRKLLVYEYMCNGSLDKWIFSKNQDIALDWQTRFQIITDVAKGLSYLHGECRQRIAHFNVKPQNILLDADFHAKVSNFGLAKLID